ncbi:MAG: hypothetical protein ACYSWZ_09525 [Planctomycetota bacterium]|jgi:hypothetical protein
MKNKMIFLFLFVPLHYLLTVVLLQYYWFNYNPDVHTALWQKCAHGLAFVLAVPVLTPFIVTDLSEYWPWMIKIPTFFFNSLIWGVVVLALFGGIKRLRGK